MPIQAEVLEAQVRVTGLDSATRDLDRLSRKSKDTGKQVTSAGKSMRNAFAGIATGAAVAGVGKFLKSTADDASDLNETVSMSTVIFGKNQKAMDRWANGAWKSVGLGKNAALSAAAGFGDMFAQLGFTERQAARMSRKVVQLSADLGSFKNLKTAEVTDMMSAAFRGEYDSLQRVIPNINAARVEHEALAATHKKSAKELTAQEKAAATLAIVQRDGSRAAGDFARTSGGAANQQKILTAQIENTKTKIGQELLPAYRDFWKFSNDKVVPGINDFIDGMKDGTGAGGKFADVVRSDIVPTVKDFAQVGKDLLPFLKGAGTLVHGLANGLESLPSGVRQNTLLIGGMALAFGKLGSSLPLDGLSTADGRGRALTNTYQRLGGVLRNVAGAGGMLLLARSTKETNFELSALERVGGAALTGASLGAFAGPQGAAVGGAVGALAGSVSMLFTETTKSNRVAKEAGPAYRSYADALGLGRKAINEYVKDLARKNLAEKNTAGTTALGDARTLGLAGSTVVSATLGNAKAIKAANEAIAKAIASGSSTAIGAATRLSTAIGVNADQLKRDTIAANEAGLALGKYKAVLPGIPKRVATRIDQIGLQAAEGKIVRLTAKYRLTPPQVKTILVAAGEKPTGKAIDNILAKAKELGGPGGKGREAKVKLGADGKDAKATMDSVLGALGMKAKARPPKVKPKIDQSGIVPGMGSAITSAQSYANSHPVRIKTVGGSALGGTILRGMAGGGTVPGPREPYGDKVLRMLAPGEEVITNRNGEADRFRALRRAGLIPGMANGGTVSKGAAAALRGELKASTLLGAVREGLKPTTRLLDRLEKLARKATGGAREKRLEKILTQQGKRLEKATSARDAIVSKIAQKTAARDELVAARDSFKENVRQGIASQANVLNSGNTASEIATNLGTQVAKANEFAKAIQDMRRAGYSSAVIQQVAGAGIEGGLEVAKALVAGSAADVSSINKSFGAITSAADQQAKLLGDQFYAAGINSANGVIAGLNSQKKDIEKTLETIAKGMVKALRKALGIKSPSVKFDKEMDWVGKGTVRGLARQQKRVAGGGSALAGAILGGFRSGQGLTPAALGGGGQARGSVVLNFNTYNPIAEPQSITTNKGLARVAAVGLV